jgi:hypothetical protein
MDSPRCCVISGCGTQDSGRNLPENHWPVSRANDLRAGQQGGAYEPWLRIDGFSSLHHRLRLEDDGSDLLVDLNPAAHEVAGGSAAITRPSLNFMPIVFRKRSAVNVTSTASLDYHSRIGNACHFVVRLLIAVQVLRLTYTWKNCSAYYSRSLVSSC